MYVLLSWMTVFNCVYTSNSKANRSPSKLNVMYCNGSSTKFSASSTVLLIFIQAFTLRLSDFWQHFFFSCYVLLSLTLAGVKTDFRFSLFYHRLIDWLSGWIWGCFACLALLIFFRFLFYFFIRRYNTEGFYVFLLFSKWWVKADLVCLPLNVKMLIAAWRTHTHSAKSVLRETWHQPLGLGGARLSPVCVCGPSLWSSSAVPHTHGGSTF